jgi:SHS family lactate transporter-like MFS transporter
MALQARTAPEVPSAAPAPPAEYTTTERRLIVVFAFLGTLFDGADFFIFTYFLAPLSRYFGISLFEVTVIQATSYLAGIIGGTLFGVMADRWGRRLGLSLTVAVYSLATLASAFAPDFWTLLVLRVIAGIGIGGESGIAYAYVNEAYHGGHSRRGLFGGALQTMFIFGGVVATWLFAFTSDRYGPDAWRWAFGYLGAVAVLAALIRVYMPESHLWQASRESIARGLKKESAPLASIFRGNLRRITLLTTLAMTFAFFGSYGILTFGPTMWLQSYQLQPSTVAMLGYIGNGLTIVSYMIAGYLSDVIGRRNAFSLAAAVGTLGYLFFLVVGPIMGLPVTDATVVASLPFVGFVLMEMGWAYFGVQGVWLGELYPTHARATAQNFVYYVARAIGAGIAPLLALSVATGLGFDVRMAVALAFIGTAGALVFSRLIPETLGTELHAD